MASDKLNILITNAGTPFHFRIPYLVLIFKSRFIIPPQKYLFQSVRMKIPARIEKILSI